MIKAFNKEKVVILTTKGRYGIVVFERYFGRILVAETEDINFSDATDLMEAKGHLGRLKLANRVHLYDDIEEALAANKEHMEQNDADVIKHTLINHD